MDYPEIYAVDFDKTLNLADKYPELGEPNMELIEFLKERRAAGDKLILWTCREGELLKAAVKYCNDYGLFFHAVNDNLPENIAYYGNNCRKVWAHHYIDDRNHTNIPGSARSTDIERLTRKETVVARGKETAACNYENDDCNDQCRHGTCRWQEKANMLLKAYEDTGLTPEQIMELKERDTAKEIQKVDEQPYFRKHFHSYICPVCHKKVEFGWLFCGHCGRKLKKKD